MSAPKAKAGHGHNINTFQVKAHVDAGDAILLDARSGKYDDGYRIPGAKSLNSKSTAEEIAQVIPSKDAQIVTYCSNLQCPASKALAEHLESLGYTHVHEYPEGIAGWRAAGGAVDKVK
jgi:rhodanese-related sulfurtransferase